MNKKALLYIPFALAPIHFETGLELVEKYLQKGYSVTLLTCFGKLPACAPNPYHYEHNCHFCQSRLLSGLKWIGQERIEVQDFYAITEEQQRKIEEISILEIPSLDMLTKIELEGSDIGLAALRSVIFCLNEPRPDVYQHKDLIRNYLVTSAIVHFSMQKHLIEKQPDEFILFNGSFAAIRPALRLAQKFNITTYVHETSDVPERYSLTKNAYPHDLEVMKAEIDFIYNTSPLPEAEKKQIADIWYEERIHNRIKSWWFDFTKNQQKGLLPQSLTPKTVNVAIFNSSEGEFNTIPEYDNPIYRNQNDGIYQLLNSFYQNDSIRFFLRIHPNLANAANNTQKKFLQVLAQEFDHLEIISPESPISTYDLISACDVIITFNSTVGIEAVYKGKPSILMGRAIYEDLGGSIKPHSHGELVEILHNYMRHRSLPSVESAELAVVKYGFFQKQWGYPLEYVRVYSLNKASLYREGKEYFVKVSLKEVALSFVPRILIKLRKLSTKYLHWNH